MKLSQKLLNDDPFIWSYDTAFKTPGRDLDDRWSLDKVSDVRSWWNFHRSFWSIIPIIWHHLQVHEDSPYPPRLQEETWRTGGALTGFLLFPSFSGTSTSSKTPGRDLEDRWSLDKVSDVRSWWNFHKSFWSMIPIIRHHLQFHHHILQDSRKRLGEQVEPWQGFCCFQVSKFDIDETFTETSEG